MNPLAHHSSPLHDAVIQHEPVRGVLRVEEKAPLGGAHTVALMEGAALVTYHRAPVVEITGIRCLDLRLPVVATWVAGDGTHDRDGLSYALAPPNPPLPAPEAILSAQEHAEEPGHAG